MTENDNPSAPNPGEQPQSDAAPPTPPPQPSEPASSVAGPVDAGAGLPSAAPSTESSSEPPSGSPSSTPATGEQPPASGAEPDAKRRRRRRRRKKPADGSGDETSPGAQSDAGSSEGSPAQKSARAPRNRRGRGKKRDGDGPRGGPAGRGRGPRDRRDDRRDDRHHALAAVQSLSQMAQDLLDIEGVEALGRPRFMDVSIRVPLDAKRDGKRSAAQLVEQILARVQEVREHENALLAGSVYCYFSESATAGSSRPTEPREVFDGYTSTGRPEFTDFVTMAIERKDAGIDEMLSGRDLVVTHVSLGRVLRTQQLAEFGKSSPVYRILGQVDAGLYDVVNGPHRAAFSFQLLRGVTLEGKPRLRIHPVSAVDVRDLADPSVAEILRRFQHALDAESLRLAGKEANGESGDEAEEAFVLPLLQDLAKRLSGRAKRQGRRTEHATQRADESQRPTTNASDDAKDAGDDAILWDDEEGTIVVVGPRGRVHVFTPDAKHVTSFRMTGTNIATRRKEGRWRPADPGARGEFRIQFRKRLAGGDAEDSMPVAEVLPTMPPQSVPDVPAAVVPETVVPAPVEPAPVEPAPVEPATVEPAPIAEAPTTPPVESEASAAPPELPPSAAGDESTEGR